MMTTVNKVTPRNGYCQSSVDTLVITSVKISTTKTTIKAAKSRGNARNLWPKTAFSSKNVTFGIIEAMLKLEAHCFCKSVISLSSPKGIVTLRNLYFQYASTEKTNP